MENAVNMTVSKLRCAVRPSVDGRPIALPGLDDALLKTTEMIKLDVHYDAPFVERALARGDRLRFAHRGEFSCVACGNRVKKLFDAFCFPCFKNRAQADLCVMNPHRCHYMKGTCREPAWGEGFCYTPHVVYLAYTDKYKIGITREGQVPTRWVDQGATAASVLARVTSRHQAGVIEDALAKEWADKSNWQRMLKEGNKRPSREDFLSVRAQVSSFLASELASADRRAELIVETPSKLGLPRDVELFETSPVFTLDFPLPPPGEWPEKITSLNLDKSPEVEGVVTGVKGQYIFFGNTVFNVRRHEGYIVDFSLE